jgi:hypothetical protein
MPFPFIEFVAGAGFFGPFRFRPRLENVESQPSKLPDWSQRYKTYFYLSASLMKCPNEL